MTYATEPHPSFIEGSALSSLILVVHTVAPPLLFVFLFEEWFLIYDLCSKAPPQKKKKAFHGKAPPLFEFQCWGSVKGT